MKKITLLLALVVFILTSASAQTSQIENQSLTHVYGINEDKFIRIPPPVDFLTKSAKDATCNIEVNYVNFSDEAKAAFEYAVAIWESLLHSNQVIKVDAQWLDLKSGDGNAILGAAGATNFYVNKDGFPQSNVFYNAPLAEKLVRHDLNGPNVPDISAFFNMNAEWYYGTDGQTPAGKYDLVSVVLHELCHGLGFLGSMKVNEDNLGIWSLGSHYPYVFDQYLYNGSNQQLINTDEFPNPSVELAQQITSEDLYFDGPVLKYNTGSTANLYAPNPFDAGSSVDHLDNVYNETENSLMTSGINTGSSIHDPGLVTMSIMEDLGWSDIFIQHQAIPDQENYGEVNITARIIPDFDTDLLNPTLNYILNKRQLQTIALDSPNNDSIYSAKINVTQDSELEYYLSVQDKYGRTYYYPNTAPQKPIATLIGADIVAPVITHIPNKYFFYGENNLVLICNVNDRLGIDTVYVEYSVNGVDKTPVGLKNLKYDIYNIVLDLAPLNLQVGDTLAYHIIASDKSIAGNVSSNPASGNYQLVVSELPEYIESYETSFETGSNEFVMNGFDYSTATGFDSPALNTKHPYATSGAESNIDYTAQFVFPVKINELYHYISFDEIALVQPGKPDSVFGSKGFNDYVIVEGSKDGGTTWIPFEDGWDCRLQPEWVLAYNQSQNFNNSEILYDLNLYRKHQIDLTASNDFSAGDIILIRFRLNSDPTTIAWGWAIDNLKIQTVGLSNHLSTLQNFNVYPNPVTSNSFKISGIKDKIERLKLYDYSGKLVYQLRNVDVNSEIHLPTSVKGLHILYLEGSKQVYRSKLLFK